jgi:mono/diheme cytochrome c family protein
LTKRGATGLVFAMVLILAMHSARAAEDVERIEKGDRIAAGFCARCHGIGRSLDSPLDAAPPFRILADDPALTEQAIRQLLRTSHEAMPDYILSTEERDALAAYIRSLAPR